MAFSNIAVNGLAAAICLILVEGREFHGIEPVYETYWWKDWLRIGLFSGGQIFLNNIIYALIVCRMVNAVAEQGNYWVANNFIWGFLLVPVMALAELIKRENDVRQFKTYIKVSLVICGIWILSVPLWDTLLKTFIGIENPEKILHILYLLLPFYFVYTMSSIYENMFIAAGKTLYNLIISLVVNIGYYGVMYVAFLTLDIERTITFICILFGGGMVVNALVGTFLFWRMRRQMTLPNA